MNSGYILDKLSCLAHKYTESIIPDKDLMSEPANLPSYNMAALNDHLKCG